MKSHKCILKRGIALATACFTLFGAGADALAYEVFPETEEAYTDAGPDDADIFAETEYTRENKELYSYLFYNDGQYTTVDRYTERGFNWDTMKWETLGHHTVITKFDSDMKTVLSRRELPEELPVWGGVSTSEDGQSYYVVTGQNNPKENNDLECVRVTKYDKNWGRLGSVGLSNCNTTKPFFYGKCSISMNGDLMLIHTSHEMYKTGDGVNHQANMSIWVDTAEMKILSHSSKVSNADDSYVSHSFYQFSAFDKDGHVVLVNHGDAYPRAAIIHVSKNAVDEADADKLPKYGEWYHADEMTFKGDTGVNDTKAVTGGLAVGDGRYLTAISSVKQDDEWKNHKTRSIYVLSANADLTEVKNADTPLVEYAEGEETAGTPVIVSVSGDRFLVMWERGGKLCSVLVNENGEKAGEITECEGRLDSVKGSSNDPEVFTSITKLGCQPVLCGDKVVWYTVSFDGAELPEDVRGSLTGSGATVWHQLDPSDLAGGVSKTQTILPEGEVKEDMTVITLDANGGSIDPAYVERVPGDKVGALPSPVYEGYEFNGWYTAKDGGEAVTADTVVTSADPFTLYAGWKQSAGAAGSEWGDILPEDRALLSDPKAVEDKLWIGVSGTKNAVYTGQAVTPEVTVYFGNTRLFRDRDYTVKYKNNKKAGDDTASLIITGKGNYTGKITKRFSIARADVGSKDLTVYEMADAYTGSAQRPEPDVFWKGKALKKDRDYSVEYSGGFTAPGTYTVKITGMGNFTGTREVPYTIVSDGALKPMNSVEAKMTQKPSAPSNEETCAKMLSVKLNGSPITKGFDVKWENNYGSGAASAILVGNGEVSDDGVTRFTGSKRVKFKIRCMWILCKEMVTITGEPVYTGVGQNPSIVVINGNREVNATLVEGRDYTLSFKNNVNAGTATAVIKGINGYRGTAEVKFKIEPAQLTQDMLRVAKTSYCGAGGAKAAVKVVCGGHVLEEGKDYKIECSGSAPGPCTFTVTGKGNYEGTITGSYTAVVRDINELVPYVNIPQYKAGTPASAYMVTPVVYDEYGEKLGDADMSIGPYVYTENTQVFESMGSVVTRAAGEQVQDTDIPVPGTKLTVKIAGTGGYCGTAEVTTQIGLNSISKKKLKAAAVEWTGGAVQTTVTCSGLSQSDLEIRAYMNNVAVGKKAKVVVYGIGDYCGAKLVTFTIKKKKLR